MGGWKIESDGGLLRRLDLWGKYEPQSARNAAGLPAWGDPKLGAQEQSWQTAVDAAQASQEQAASTRGAYSVTPIMATAKM